MLNKAELLYTTLTLMLPKPELGPKIYHQFVNVGSRCIIRRKLLSDKFPFSLYKKLL